MNHGLIYLDTGDILEGGEGSIKVRGAELKPWWGRRVHGLHVEMAESGCTLSYLAHHPTSEEEGLRLSTLAVGCHLSIMPCVLILLC
jgi:hypothetical protein